MTFTRTCSKCNDTFVTGDRKDTLCCHCDGSVPRLTYYNLNGDKLQ